MREGIVARRAAQKCERAADSGQTRCLRQSPPRTCSHWNWEDSWRHLRFLLRFRMTKCWPHFTAMFLAIGATSALRTGAPTTRPAVLGFVCCRFIEPAQVCDFGSSPKPTAHRPASCCRRTTNFMTKHEVTFTLKSGNSGLQRTVVTASDPTTARKIWEQQNPGCRLSSINQVRKK